MTNGEKYKTARERAKAFKEFRMRNVSYGYKCETCNDNCAFEWLDLEAEAK